MAVIGGIFHNKSDYVLKQHSPGHINLKLCTYHYINMYIKLEDCALFWAMQSDSAFLWFFFFFSQLTQWYQFNTAHYLSCEGMAFSSGHHIAVSHDTHKIYLTLSSHTWNIKCKNIEIFFNMEPFLFGLVVSS